MKCQTVEGKYLLIKHGFDQRGKRRQMEIDSPARLSLERAGHCSLLLRSALRVQTKSLLVYILSIFVTLCNFRDKHADNVCRVQT